MVKLHTELKIFLILFFLITLISTSSALKDPDGNIWLEAESAAGNSQFSPMLTGFSSNASDGGFITTANTGREKSGGFSDSGVATYEFRVDKSGEYTVWGRTISIANGNSFHISVDGGPFKEWSMPLQSNWNWNRAGQINKPYTYTLESGTHTLKIAYKEDGAALDRVLITDDSSLEPSVTGYSQPSQSPYAPGRIEAENYDKGGQGTAYHDTTAENKGEAYRDDAVDIEPASDGGYNLGWMSDGEWLEYTTNVPEDKYDLRMRVAGKDTGVQGQLRVIVGGQKVKTVDIPNTGKWQDWITVTVPDVNVPEGNQIRLEVIGGGYNLNWIELTEPGSETNNTEDSSPRSSQSPYTSHNLPGKIQAENYDKGESGVAYYDTTSGNEEEAYRSTDVDISDYGKLYAVSWTSGGEWMEYTTNVEPGTYDIKVKATGMSDGKLKFNLGSEHIGTLSLPSSGGWDNWSVYTLEDVKINQSGEKELRATFKSGGMTVDWIEFRDSSVKEECNEGRLDVNSNFQMIDNQWSVPEAEECVRVNSDGSYGWEWNATGTSGGPNYPEVFIGTRPWGSSTGVSEFPIQRGNVEEFTIDVQNDLQASGGEWNLAEEWWLMEKKPSVETKTRRHEVMLLLNWSEDHNHGEVMYDGLWTDKYGNTIDLWTIYDHGDGKNFYIFRVDGGHDGGKINMKRITDWLTKKEGIRKDLWLSGVELGNEYWAPTTGQNTIKRFDVTINGQKYESGPE